MDEQTEAKNIDNGLELKQLSLPFKWEGPSATIAKGGALCMILSRSELASLGLSHLQMFPSNTTSSAFLDAGATVSSSQIISSFTDVLPVLKTKAVLDAEKSHSSEASSPLPARSHKPRKKAMSMDEIALYEQLYGGFMYPGSEEDEWEMKETRDNTGMVAKERSEASNVWQENCEAKFLLQVMPWELTPLAPLRPFESTAAVPFKWEDAPGKPKPEAVSPKLHPRLQLPPRLYARSNPLPLSDKNGHSQVKRILQIMLPASRSKKTSKSHLQEIDEKTPAACTISEGGSSPNSILQGFDAQSQASSTSPDIPLASDVSLACSADRQLYFKESSRELPSSSSNNFNTPSSSPYTDFGPVDGAKGSRHLHLAVENIKQAVRSWNRNKSGGRRNHRSMDFDGAEVWSPTLAIYYQQHEDATDGIKDIAKDQRPTGDERTEYDPKAVQTPEKFSVNQTTRSPRSFISDSTSITTQSTELRSRMKRSLRKCIMDKMQRSYTVAVQYIKFRSK